MKPAVKVLFASGSRDLIAGAIDRLKAIHPELPLEVVAEFPPTQGHWTPYRLRRSLRDNLARCRARFCDKDIRIAAVILDGNAPYWRLRLLALLLAPLRLLAFNENLDHFMFRPRSGPAILRHLMWRFLSFLVREAHPGGDTYTLLWRLAHPAAFRRPALVLLGKIAGLVSAALKWRAPAVSAGAVRPMPEGISVVIASRNAQSVLDQISPGLLDQAFEIIIVDEPVPFARAANIGIRKARFSHVCLLSDETLITPECLPDLRAAFDRIPDLFCATAPTCGKPVMPTGRNPADVPIGCERPADGENLGYVLHGDFRCSLFHTARLRALEGLDEVYESASIAGLDLGTRAWERCWPTVFVSSASFAAKGRLDESVESVQNIDYLRFVARTISGSAQFRRFWGDALARLNLLAARETPDNAAVTALGHAWKAPFWTRRRPSDPRAVGQAFALASGDVSVIPGDAHNPRTPTVLIATSYLPFPLSHGGAVRMFNLMRRAAPHFNQVLVSFVNELAPVPPELRSICSEVVLVRRVGAHDHAPSDRPDMVEEFDSPAFHAALLQAVRKWKPDIAQLEFTHMAQYASDCAPAKTVLVEHDITFDLYQQLLRYNPDWELRRQLQRWTAFETAAWKQVDCVVAMSPKDQRAIPGAVCLPNGVDLQRFRPSRRAPDPGRLLFVGSFAHLPNLMAIDFFLRECWPHLSPLGIKLHIIAGAQHTVFLDRFRNYIHPRFDQPGIELEGFVADVRPAYERATVVIAPLLVSAGTNVKIMEAMAMGKAVVATPAGLNGLELTSGRDVIIVQSETEMTEAIRHLLDNPAKRRDIEMQARKTAEQEFDWDTIAAAQLDLYERMLGLARGARYAVR